METMENNIPSATHQEKAKNEETSSLADCYQSSRSGYYCLGSD